MTRVYSRPVITSQAPRSATAPSRPKNPTPNPDAALLAALREHLGLSATAPAAEILAAFLATPKPASGLTPAERAKCKAKGIDPKKYAETRAGIRARSHH